MMLLFAFVAGFQGNAPEPLRMPASDPEYDACDPGIASEQIIRNKKLPRNILYRYGRKSISLQNVASKTITQSVWDEYIMGENTRYSLKPFRRGLYGTELVESADRYGTSKYDWLLEIRLHESCLKPVKVTTLHGLNRDYRFIKWFQGKDHGISLSAWQQKCFQSQEPNPQEFTFFHSQGIETICEKVVGDYLRENDFALIQDRVSDLTLSWAVRDRACIKSILGSQNYWAKEFAYRKELWENRCVQNRFRNHRNNIRVWFSAMSDSGYSSRELDQFAEMIAKVKQPEDVRDWQTDEVDRFAAQDFATTLSRVGLRCEKSGKKYKFQEVLGGIASNVDDLQSEDVKITLESACR